MSMGPCDCPCCQRNREDSGRQAEMFASVFRGVLGMTEVREALAAESHEAWSGWMGYLFDKSVRNPDGSVTIPKDLADRWNRLSVTLYDRLTDVEKASDLAEADRYIAVLAQGL